MTLLQIPAKKSHLPLPHVHLTPLSSALHRRLSIQKPYQPAAVTLLTPTCSVDQVRLGPRRHVHCSCGAGLGAVVAAEPVSPQGSEELRSKARVCSSTGATSSPASMAFQSVSSSCPQHLSSSSGNCLLFCKQGRGVPCCASATWEQHVPLSLSAEACSANSSSHLPVCNHLQQVCAVASGHYCCLHLEGLCLLQAGLIAYVFMSRYVVLCL